MSDQPSDTPETPAPKPKRGKAKPPSDTTPPQAESLPEDSNADTDAFRDLKPEGGAPEPATSEAVPASVQDELTNRMDEAPDSRNELVFDPTTGELVVKPKGAALDSDAVIVSEIADEGFFAGAG